MVSVAQMKQVSEVETRFVTSGEAETRRAIDGLSAAQERLATGAQAVAVVTEQVERKQLNQAKAADTLRAKLDEQVRAQQRLQADLGKIQRYEGVGLYDAQEAARLRGLAEDRYGSRLNDNKPAANGGLSSYDRMFVRYQAFDVGSQLYSGASPSIVAVQQGSQVLQQLADREGGLTAGLKQLGVSALGLITPFTLTTTAVAGAAAAFALAAKQASDDRAVLERSTQGLGRGTGATVGDLDALAKANSDAGRVSVSTAREIVAGYTSTGQIAIPVIGELTRVTSEYARLVGSDVPAATSELARMFTDPARGAEELASKIGGLSDRTLQLIQTQIEQGDRSAAQQTLADNLKASIDANTQATTGWAAAWNAAATAAGNYWEAAKRIAGIKLGVVPEGAQEALDRLSKQVDTVNANRRGIGQGPLELGSNLVRDRDAAAIIADTERRQREAAAAEARADRASLAAGQIARAADPNFDRLSTLRKQQSDLSDALADPLARSKLADFGQTESAYLGVTRAIESLTDANGKLISSQELSRRQDQLRLDAVNATTAAEKASVAERQKAFDLIGKTIEPGDARGQIERAGQLARASEAAKGGKSDSDSRDDYDRAVRSLEDRIRRQQQEAQTFGMGAEAAARYRAETDLLTAAKRAERDITPELTAQIQGYADRAGTAAAQQEKLRESMRDMDELRSTGRDAFGSMFRDLAHGTSAADAFANALSRISDRITNLAADSLADALFGKRGSSGSGMLSGLLGNSGGGGLGGFFTSLFGGGTSAGASPTGGVRLFDVGGYTGAGGRLDPAGIVHRGEYVFDAASTKRIGVHVLEGMRRGVPGYDTGGSVGVPAWMPPPANAVAMGAAPAFNFIDQRPAGSPDIEPTARRRADGGFDVIVRGVEGRMGQRAASGQGPFKQAAGGAGFRNG